MEKFSLVYGLNLVSARFTCEVRVVIMEYDYNRQHLKKGNATVNLIKFH